jgi:hypothetical protein
MGASHFVWIRSTPQEVKNQLVLLLKTSEPGLVTTLSNIVNLIPNTDSNIQE